MSAIKLKNIQQTVISTVTQPLKLGGIAEDGSDAKITIGTDGKITQVQEDWITPTFLNGWLNFGSPYANLKIMKDSMGFVHIKGFIKSGTIPSAIFNLPVGYRPIEKLVFLIASATTTGQIIIETNGNVMADAGSTTWMCLDVITFRAEA